MPNIKLQDQEGRTFDFLELFGRPVVVLFFYTRCENPKKCSLSVSKLAKLARDLDERGFAGRAQTAAISYEPGFDTPQRLAAYGSARRFPFGVGHRMVRAVVGFDDLRRAFRLRVGMVSAIVNRHRSEVFTLDRQGHIAAELTRSSWEENEVLRILESLANEPAPSQDEPSRLRTGVIEVARLAPQFGPALMPKCPFCWASYLSLAGLTQVPKWLMTPYLLPLLASLVFVQLWSTWRRAVSNGTFIGFGLSLLGSGTLMIGCALLKLPHAAALGVLLCSGGALFSVSRRGRVRA